MTMKKNLMIRVKHFVRMYTHYFSKQSKYIRVGFGIMTIVIILMTATRLIVFFTKLTLL